MPAPAGPARPTGATTTSSIPALLVTAVWGLAALQPAAAAASRAQWDEVHGGGALSRRWGVAAPQPAAAAAASHGGDEAHGGVRRRGPAAAAGALRDPPTYTALTAGTPLLATVAFQQYAYFSFNLTQQQLTLGDVYFLVTAIDGNPDLYVRLGGGEPSSTAASYQSANWAYASTEAVRVSLNDGVVLSSAACQAPFSERPRLPCPALLAVYGTRGGNFSIVAELAEPTGADLIIGPGQPAVASLPPPTADGASGSVLVIARLTDPRADTVNMALYGFGSPITVLWGSSARGVPSGTNPASYCARWDASTLNTNVFHSTNSTADPCWCGALAVCTFYALVTAQVPTAPTSVYAQWYLAYNGSGANAPGTIETLLDGVPQGGELSQGEYGYYIFNALVDPLAPEQDVVVTLTPTLGDADLFVTLDGSQPSSSNYQFQSVRGAGADRIEIETQPLTIWRRFCAVAILNVAPCPVRIAVHGWSIVTAYVISATVAAHVTLLNELPVTLTTPAFGGMRYCAYYAFNNDAVTFTLTPLAGLPPAFMYVSSSARGGPFPVPGNASTYFASSATQVTLVPGVTAGACAAPPCTYYVGVSGGFIAATFTLLAATNTSNPTLPLNTPVHGSVAAFSYDHYLLRWPSPDVENVVVTVDTTVGFGVALGAFDNSNVEFSSAVRKRVFMRQCARDGRRVWNRCVLRAPGRASCRRRTSLNLPECTPPTAPTPPPPVHLPAAGLRLAQLRSCVQPHQRGHQQRGLPAEVRHPPRQRHPWLPVDGGGGGLRTRNHNAVRHQRLHVGAGAVHGRAHRGLRGARRVLALPVRGAQQPHAHRHLRGPADG